MPEASLAHRLKHWNWLLDRVQPLLDEVPHLSADYTALRETLASVVTLGQEQVSVTAKLREATRLRDEAADRARKLRNRIVAGLQQHFGPESERLIAFGVSPRTFHGRRKKEAPPGTSGGSRGGAGPARLTGS